ncbi:hypothetical protein KPZU09_70910 [Klebsiella pneumoniae]|uniref:Uncharacterized protein n=1 Tax=Klebsiella pneumoniae TaxID=573 RepID=A0A919LYU4_KLEPN|nr:hypothetical protein KPZU09_70910 [Klebsiella pneumoniae]
MHLMQLSKRVSFMAGLRQGVDLSGGVQRGNGADAAATAELNGIEPAEQ